VTVVGKKKDKFTKEEREKLQKIANDNIKKHGGKQVGTRRFDMTDETRKKR
jgi:hypothetical protein